MLDQRIEKIKQSIVENIMLVDKMIEQTMNGAVNQDWDKIQEVIDEFEPQADQFKVTINQECLGVLALFHPEAKQLRTIVKMSGMANDLERIGDLATKIALSTYHWQDAFSLKEYPRIIDMGKETRKMLKDVLKGFQEENSLLAIQVIQHDDRVDELCTYNIKKIIKDMNQTEQVEPLLQIMNITRHLERIADLCTHFAEDIIFIKDGLIPEK